MMGWVGVVAALLGALAGAGQPPAVCMTGLDQQQAGDNAGALQSYQRCLREAPEFTPVLLNLAGAEQALGQTHQAIAHYRQFLQYLPDSTQAHCNLGAALQEIGELSQAVEHYTAGLRTKPDFVEIYSNLGVAQHDKDPPDYRGAVKSFNQALRFRPGGAAAWVAADWCAAFPEARYNLGRSMEAIGLQNTNKALAQYERAVALNPVTWRRSARLMEFAGIPDRTKCKVAAPERYMRLEGRARCCVVRVMAVSSRQSGE